MAHTPKNWENWPSQNTPVSAEALEDLEVRLGAYADSVSFSGGVVDNPAAANELAYDPDETFAGKARWRRRRTLDVTDYASITTGWNAFNHDVILNALATDPAYADMEVYIPPSINNGVIELHATVPWLSANLGTKGPRIIVDEKAIVTPASDYQGGKLFDIRGRSLDTVLATSDIAVGDRTLHMTGPLPASFVPGRLCKLGVGLTTATSRYPGAHSSLCVIGEMVQIESIVGSDVTLTEPVAGPGPYLVADQALLLSVETVDGGGVEMIVENLYQPAFADITVAHAGMVGFNRQYCRNFNDFVIVRKSNSRGYKVLHCYDFDAVVEGHDLMDKDDPSGGSLGYAVDYSGTSRYGRFRITAERCRHSFTNTQGFEGPRDATIYYLHAREMTSAAVDTHDEGTNIHFGKVIVKNTRSIGMQARAKYVTVDSLYIENCGLADLGYGGIGLWIQGEPGAEGCEFHAGRVVIRNILDGIYNPQSNPGGSSVNGHGVRVDGTNAPARKVKIAYLEVDGCDGVGLSLGPQISAEGYKPVEIGKAVIINYGRKDTGVEYAVEQSTSGTSQRPWESQSVIDVLDAGPGAVAVQCIREGIIRCNHLIDRGVNEATSGSVSGIRYNQIFKSDPSGEIRSAAATLPRAVITDVWDGISSRAMVAGLVKPKAPGKYSKFRFALAGEKNSISGCATTNASPTITVSSSSQIRVGDMVVGAGIAANARVAKINSTTSVDLTDNASATASGLTFTFYHNKNTKILTGCSVTSGSPTVTCDWTGEVQKGDLIFGTGFTSGGRVKSVDSATQFTMASNSSATGSARNLRVNPGWQGITDFYVAYYRESDSALLAYSANLASSIFDGEYIEASFGTVTAAGGSGGYLQTHQGVYLRACLMPIGTFMGGYKGTYGSGGLFSADDGASKGASTVFSTGNPPPDPMPALSSNPVMPFLELVH